MARTKKTPKRAKKAAPFTALDDERLWQVFVSWTWPTLADAGLAPDLDLDAPRPDDDERLLDHEWSPRDAAMFIVAHGARLLPRNVLDGLRASRKQRDVIEAGIALAVEFGQSDFLAKSRCSATAGQLASLAARAGEHVRQGLRKHRPAARSIETERWDGLLMLIGVDDRRASPPPHNGRKAVTIHVTPDEYARMKELAAATGVRGAGSIARALLLAGLDRHDRAYFENRANQVEAERVYNAGRGVAPAALPVPDDYPVPPEDRWADIEVEQIRRGD